MSIETIETVKRGGNVVFVAGVPAMFAHVTLPQIYTILGIIWIGWQILSGVFSAIRKWLDR